MKERKMVVAVPPGALTRVIGGVTEGLDMVDCLHKSLPKHLQAQKRMYKGKDGKWQRSKEVSVQRKAAAIYKAMSQGENWTPTNIASAIIECGWQQFTDRIYAELGRAGAKAGRRLGLSHGFGLGGSVRQGVTGGMTPLR